MDHSYDQVVTFGRVLFECGQVADCDELLAYFERPWRWTNERNKFLELGGRADEETLQTMSELWASGGL